MGKQPKKSAAAKSADTGFKFSNYVPEKYQTPALLLLILLLILIFFSPVMFGDKTTSSGDLIQVKSLREYATKDYDGFSLWNPYIFCGMPAVATSMSLRWFDLTADVYSYASKVYSAFFHDYNAIYTFSFLILAFTAFFFMRSFGAGRGISFLVSIATIFSTGIVLLFYIGHITKLMSLAVLPFILMMLFKFQKKITWLDVALFLLGMHLLVLGAHVQIVFYFILVTAIYFIYFFARSFIAKDKAMQKQLLKSLGVVVAAGLIALIMSFDTYYQLLEYKPYSTRGTKSVTELKETGAEVQNNAYEYATNWSFSPGEMMTFIVPSYYGFGKSTYNGPLTQNQDYEVNTYFGQMTSVDVAMYMGIIIFALGIFTLFVKWKDPIVQFFGIVVILFLLLSFGRTFPLIYNLFYYHFPGFDNFRSPSMILHILQIIFPILAGLGLMQIISIREEKNPKKEKVFKYVALFLAGLFVVFFLLSGSIGSWFTQRVNDYAASLGKSQQEAPTFNALAEYVTSRLNGDLLASFALLALTFGLINAFIKSKLNKKLFVAGLVLVVVLFLLLSFGKSFPFIYNLFYYRVAGIDNFQSSSMILHIIQIIFPIFAGLSVIKFIPLDKEKNAMIKKIFKYIAVTFSVLFVLFFIISRSMDSWFTQRVNDYAASLGQSQRAQQEAQTFNALAEYMTDMFKGDLLASFALLAIVFSLIYMFIKSKINKELFIAGIAVLVLFDLFRVSHRGESYVESERVNDLFREPNYISITKQQNDKVPHRLLNLKRDGSLGSFSANANFNVYFLQEDFYGYSAAKPRSYQDIMDVVGPVNPTLWRMLDVKYIVTDRVYTPAGLVPIYQGKDEFVYKNENALPRVYFVDSVAQKSGVDILKAVKENSFDPKKLAFVENLDFKFDKGDSTNFATIISYKDESLTSDVNCKGNNFLFFGTTYLPGWKAFVDGSAVTVHKADYGFQGIVVPQGKHKVEFVYEPKGFVAGKYLSLILNIMMFGGIGFVLYTAKQKKASGKK